MIVVKGHNFYSKINNIFTTMFCRLFPLFLLSLGKKFLFKNELDFLS
jgi:hypothetical protein